MQKNWGLAPIFRFTRKITPVAFNSEDSSAAGPGAEAALVASPTYLRCAREDGSCALFRETKVCWQLAHPSLY